MILRNIFLIGTLAALLPAVASAQHPRVRPSASILFGTAEASSPADTLNLPKTYWKEGAIVGGTIVGAYGALAFNGLCRMGGPDDCGLAWVGGAMFGFLIGAIPGALVGGLFEKP